MSNGDYSSCQGEKEGLVGFPAPTKESDFLLLFGLIRDTPFHLFVRNGMPTQFINYLSEFVTELSVD